jgi:hypothetical protein
VTTSGGEFAELAESAGLVLDPWQRLALDVMLAETAAGLWAAFETALIVARQNGKGADIEALELGGLYLLGEQILHTAQLMQTSRSAFRRVLELITNTDYLRKRVRKVRTANEDHSIELLSGAKLSFGARSARAGRGDAYDRVVYDEAMFLGPEDVAAQVPTMSTRRNPQLNYFSSAGRAESEHLRSVRARGISGSPGLAYLEWSAPEPEPGGSIDLDDEDLVRQANPALGIRITLAYVRNERHVLGAAEYARERLGIFDAPGTGTRLIGAQAWSDHLEPGSTIEGIPVFGVDVNPERTAAAIGVAGFRPDGGVLVELPAPVRDADPAAGWPQGLDWVVARAVELDAEHGPTLWAVEANGPAGPLAQPLEDAGLTVVRLTGPDLARACMGFVDVLPFHLGDGVLDDAIEAVRKRPIGDGSWAFGRKTSAANIAPAVAVAIARHVLLTEDVGPSLEPVTVGAVGSTRPETADLERIGF